MSYTFFLSFSLSIVSIKCLHFILYDLELCVNGYFIIAEDFITPPSSPPEPDMETENSVLPSGSKNEQDMSGDELYEHMYDR